MNATGRLSGRGVVVTRPRELAEPFARLLEQHGARAIVFPALEIQPLPPPPTLGRIADFDLVVFVSPSAVRVTLAALPRRLTAAAIGAGTARELERAGIGPVIAPVAGADSEALLALPQMHQLAGKRVLIVRGEGGRELLRDTFAEHGMVVETREVYRRVRPNVDAAKVAEVEARWSDEGIDVVTATSIETLQNLQALLTEHGRQLLSGTALLVPSRRIVAAAVSAGLRGEAIVAAGADDASMIGALAQWRMRARAG